MSGQKILKRAQTDDQKLLRQAKILEVAKRKFSDEDFDKVTLNAIAEEAGVVKGTLYLYYQSKEAIALAVLVQELKDWSRELESSLEGKEVTLSDLAGSIASLTVGRVLIRKLFTILHTILEKNISPQVHLQFKQSLLELMSTLATVIRTKIPGLKGGVENFLMNLWVIIIGTFNLGSKAENTELLASHPQIANLYVDHEVYLRGIILQLLG